RHTRSTVRPPSTTSPCTVGDTISTRPSWSSGLMAPRSGVTRGYCLDGGRNQRSGAPRGPGLDDRTLPVLPAKLVATEHAVVVPVERLEGLAVAFPLVAAEHAVVVEVEALEPFVPVVPVVAPARALVLLPADHAVVVAVEALELLAAASPFDPRDDA